MGRQSSGFSPAALGRLGLSREMLGAVERLDLPHGLVDQARGPASMGSPPQGVPGAGLVWPQPSAAATEVDARSDVLRQLGVDLALQPAGGILHVMPQGAGSFQLRAALPDAPVYPPDGDGGVRIALRQLGRFVIESTDGVVLAVGWVESDALLLQPVYGWPAPPLEDWNVNTTDRAMQDIVARGRDTDAWQRTVLAGVLARLATPAAVDVRALMARGDVTALSRAFVVEPRGWARRLAPSAVDALEAHATRRARALGHDLADLFDTLSIEGFEASRSWEGLCYRRDDLEGIRVLLREGGAGHALERLLADADRTGRAVRGNLGDAVDATDERLRRVALGDPAAWWGSTAYHTHLF